MGFYDQDPRDGDPAGWSIDSSRGVLCTDAEIEAELWKTFDPTIPKYVPKFRRRSKSGLPPRRYFKYPPERACAEVDCEPKRRRRKHKKTRAYRKTPQVYSIYHRQALPLDTCAKPKLKAKQYRSIYRPGHAS